jgi:SNF2 family DNA or RNA helicase
MTAINDLKYNRFQVRKILVIAPLKVAEDTWVREQAKWEHLRLLKISTVLGTVTKRVKALCQQADVYVINRENVVWLVEYYRNRWPFDMVVIDELSSFKSNQAKRFKALKKVRPHIKRIVGLTGTPAPNGLEDLWAQVYLLDEGKRLGKTLGEYRKNYFLPDKRNREQIFSYKPTAGANEEVENVLRDICISMKAEDYLDMPERIDVNRYVNLDPATLKKYKDFEREMYLEIDEDNLDAGTAAVLSNKLLQFCNGAVYDAEKSVIDIHNHKLDAFLECIEELQGTPVLVFYNYQHDKDRIMKALEKHKDLVVGAIKTSEDIASWNAGKINVLLAHPASVAYGLNLQDGGHHIIWFGMNWSLELYQQANARLHRQGQKMPVTITHLIVPGMLDEDVKIALEGKGDTQEALMLSLKAKIKEVKEGKGI